MTDHHRFHLNLLKIAYNNLLQQPIFMATEKDDDARRCSTSSPR